jgi:anti-sigma regulatory factor (Ser/Thr protein kinase)
MVDTAWPRRRAWDATRQVASSHEPVAAVGGQIRRSVRAQLTDWGMTAEAVDDAVLVVEELVANVVDHARTRFQLLVALTGPVLHVAVRDWCDRSPQLRPFDPHAARGRGLQVIATLARQWGCDHHDRGKTVWADLTA